MGNQNLAVKRPILPHRQLVEIVVLQLQRGFKTKIQENVHLFFSATHHQNSSEKRKVKN